MKRFKQLIFAVAFAGLWCGNSTAQNAQQFNTESYSLVPLMLQRSYAVMNGDSAKAPLTILNQERSQVTDFEYTIFDGSTPLQTKTVHLPSTLYGNGSMDLEIKLAPDSKATLARRKLVITKVNGQLNRASNPEIEGDLVTLTAPVRRRTVIEEFTALWCPHCPAGYVAMEKLAEMYPDDFIGIVIHSRDAMAFYIFNSRLREVSGIPKSIVNRSYQAHPFIGTRATNNNRFGIAGDVAYENARLAEADVSVEAHWDAQQKGIDVVTKTVFRSIVPGADYALAYIITTDGLTNSSWWQSNNLRGDTYYIRDVPEMKPFVTGGRSVSGLTFNQIAVTGQSIDKGIDGSIATPLQLDATQIHKYKFDQRTDLSLVQHKDKVNMCALLIDRSTKKIVNAAKCRVVNAVPTGIASAPSAGENVHETARYTVDGQFIAAPVKGINIVKYSDGRVVKEVVK